jgi:glycosyltransferase involved in cell wall biosynthesis
MKISIITVCHNSEKTLTDTLNSVLSQRYQDIEHIIVDGMSSDNTHQIIKEYKHHNKKIIIESDNGIYDAMNKGINAATGEVITILNSDDIYQSSNVISEVVKDIKLDNNNNDIFLGDVVFFKEKNFSFVRRFYSSKHFKPWMLKIGLMPPHPSSFIKKKVYDENGLYDSSLKLAADFDIFLRFLLLNKKPYKYLSRIIVRMRMGGASGKNLSSYLLSSKEILYSLKKNQQSSNIFKILIRIPSKFYQFANILNQKRFNSDFILSKNYFTVEKKLLQNINLITNINSLPIEKNFILSGMNLAFLGFYSKGDINISENFYNWPDGIFVKSLNRSIKKIAGRELIREIKLPKSINKINIIGNLTYKSKEYLEKKFKKPVVNHIMPYGSINKLINYLPLLNKDDLTFITLPTPKQEQLATELQKLNKDYKIICIGASVAIASGEEKQIPVSLERLNLEFMWRLRTDTIRRVIRLFTSLIYYLKGRRKKIYSKFKVNIID